jgi:hypothetical protein
MLALTAWFVFLFLLSLAKPLVTQVVLGATLIFVLWMAISLCWPGPVRLSLDNRGAVLHYRFGGSKVFSWYNSRSIVFLHDIRGKLPSKGKQSDYDVWAATKSGWILSPLSVAAHAAWVSEARSRSCSVSQVGPSRGEKYLGFPLPGDVRLRIQGGPTQPSPTNLK